MAGFNKSETIWLNGEFVPWDAARVHVMAHALHYGSGVFEGIRSYETAHGTAVFRLDDHLRRLFRSASFYELAIPYTIEQLTDVTLELVRRNRLADAYVRPIAFFDAHSLAVWPRDCPVSVAIAAMPMGAYLAGGPERGVRVTISPVRRIDSDTLPASVKACGHYTNSVRAVQDALRRGFDEALLLNRRGEIAEGSGENLFVVKGGRLTTNDADASIVMGITRDSIIEIARDLALPLEIRGITIDDVRTADELFFTGTAVEVTPIRELDGKTVGAGAPGPITAAVQRTFFDAVHGRRPEYRRWLAFAAPPRSAIIDGARDSGRPR